MTTPSTPASGPLPSATYAGATDPYYALQANPTITGNLTVVSTITAGGNISSGGDLRAFQGGLQVGQNAFLTGLCQLRPHPQYQNGDTITSFAGRVQLISLGPAEYGATLTYAGPVLTAFSQNTVVIASLENTDSTSFTGPMASYVLSVPNKTIKFSIPSLIAGLTIGVAFIIIPG